MTAIQLTPASYKSKPKETADQVLVGGFAFT
jgi:hypothetical protein